MVHSQDSVCANLTFAFTPRALSFSSMRRILIPLTLGLLCSCQAVSRPATHASVEGALQRETAEWRGQKFVQDRCADCHSVTHSETSPLPAAPPFAAIANGPELTKVTLATWLSNHKNFPEEMYFEVPAEHLDDIAAYILTLRRTQQTP